MKRTNLLLAVLCAGCDSAASQTADDQAARFAVRERQLIEMCNEIAIEREVLAAKYNSLLEVYNLDYRPEPVIVKRCS